ncbi:hypothetical protein Tco_1379199 [Tanacetum coccineum]
MLDRKELSLTLDDFRTIFHLPQASANNHERFIPPPSFVDMVPFYKNELGFTMELKTTSSFKTTGILQPWQTLYKVGMNIPDWMITDEMKLTEHYRMYAERRSPRLTPPAPVLTIDEADDMILQDTIQVSLAEQKSREQQEAKENVELVKEHLAAEEIEKMVEEIENVVDDSSNPRIDENDIPGTRIEPRSDKESPEVKINDSEKANNVEEEITNVVILVNVDDEEEEITDEELQGRYGYLFGHLKARFMERKSFNTLADHLQDVMVESLPLMVDKHIKEQVTQQVLEQVDTSVRSYMSGHILYVHPAQPTTSSAQEQQYQLYLSMKDDLQLQQEDIAIWLALKMKFERLQVPATTCRTPAVRPRDQDYPHDDAHPEGENSAKRQKMSKYRAYISDDDEIPTKLVSQDIMDKVSLTIDEAMLKKVADEMLRQICISGDEHQYHIDQMKKFLESDIVWESRKEILVSPHPRKATLLVQSCQRDPEAPALSLVNQDLLYLKKGSSGSEKIVLSLYKFPAVIFNDDDIEERTSRWKEPGKAKEVVYSNSKIIQVIKTYWELGHEHKFITEIVARRANECIVSITEPDFKNLNKNDIEDMYLLIMNGKVPDYAETGLLWSLSVFIRSSVIWERVHDFQLGVESYQQKVNLTAPAISFPGIEKHKMFSIIHEPVYGIIYKNSKKEKRVVRHSEVHKFCDATLNRVLKGLKSYNNDVKYGYIQRELTKEDVEYLQLFEEEIDERLKHRNQMRRWEMYVNGRPLGPRRERPE